MIGFIIRRIGQALIVIVGVTLIVFILRHLLPGNIARAILGIRATPPAIAAFNRQNGLDKPLPQQFVNFFWRMAHGDFGTSTRSKRPVSEEIGERFMPTLLLTIASMVW